MEASSKNMQAIIFALMGFALFNIADAILKEVTQHYETSFTGLIVVLCELTLVLTLSPFIGGLKPVFQTPKLKLNIIRGFFATFCWLFFIVGLKFIDMSANYSILLSAPFWTAIACVLFFKHHFGIHRWIAIAVGFIGVLIVLRPGTDSFQMASLLPLMAALCFSGVAITARILGENEKQVTLLFYICICNILVFTIYTAIEDTWQVIEPQHLIYFILSGAFYVGGNLLANRAFMMGDPATINPMQYSQIIWGALIGYIFFAEVPERWTLLGAAIIIISGIYLIYREHKVGTALKVK